MEETEDPPFTASFHALDQPDIAFLLRYWLDRREDGLPPLRRRMEPSDFPHLLPRIAVMETVPTEGGEVRIRYRLTGSEIVARIGRDPTGWLFDEFYDDDDAAETLRLYCHLRETGHAFASHASYAVSKMEENMLVYDRLILPMRSNADVTMADQFMLLIVVVEQTGDFQPVGSFWEAKR